MGLNELNKEIEVVCKTIDNANIVLSVPSTAVNVSYSDKIGGEISRRAPILAKEFQKTIGRGRPDIAVIGGACIGAAWLVAKGVDITKETLAKKKAREQLLGLYQELAVKQNLLIDEQSRIIHLLDSEKNILEEEQEKMKRDLVVISEMIKEIGSIQEKRSI